VKFYIIVKKIFPDDTPDVGTKWFSCPTKCDPKIVCDEWYKIHFIQFCDLQPYLGVLVPFQF